LKFRQASARYKIQIKITFKVKPHKIYRTTLQYNQAGDKLSQACVAIDAELKREITNFCRHIAGSSQVTAIALVDSCSTKTPVKSTLQVLAILHNYQPRLGSNVKTFEGKTVVFLAVDQWIFERDIDRGFLGEAIASKLVFPYQSLLGESYLEEKEVALKKRLILELLENLAITYPELAYYIKIKPEYFLYEVILSRMRVFPLLAYELSELLEGCKIKDEDQALKTYLKALKQLDSDQKIERSGDYITISKAFAVQSQNPKVRLMNLSKNAPRALFTSVFGIFPQLLNTISQNTEEFLKTQKISWRSQVDPNCFSLDSQKYLFVPMSGSLVPFSDRVDIKGFAEKIWHLKASDVQIEPIGGMLNDVFVITTKANGTEQKVLVKRFKDWSGFKWFPLTLWSMGAKSFAVSGKARLGKECAASESLRLKGFNVPKILHVSNGERLIFMQFIEGKDLSQSIKKISLAKNEEDYSGELMKIEQAGTILAKVHSSNITLGDTKPENTIINPNGEFYLIDFEQAAQGGDKTWDIAEFLYYSGHYLQPLYSNVKAEAITKSFIKGYLKAGGNPDDIKKAALRKYTRVFSVFTMPAIITSIANICKQTEGQD
jgi:tRNA A-37 threonylcarbamoyl transferase component Bud32